MPRVVVSMLMLGLAACGASSHSPDGDDDDIGDSADVPDDTPASDLPDGLPGDPGCPSSGCDDYGDVADAGPAVAQVDHYCGDFAFPVFDRSCDHTNECMLVEHESDCCGSIRWMGIPTRLEAEFDEAEAACRASYPACHCDPSYAVEEDADYDVDADDRDVIAAACMAGEYCLSLVP